MVNRLKLHTPRRRGLAHERAQIRGGQAAAQCSPFTFDQRVDDLCGAVRERL
jgi:hypothetical protein